MFIISYSMCVVWILGDLIDREKHQCDSYHHILFDGPIILWKYKCYTCMVDPFISDDMHQYPHFHSEPYSSWFDCKIWIISFIIFMIELIWKLSEFPEILCWGAFRMIRSCKHWTFWSLFYFIIDCDKMTIHK